MTRRGDAHKDELLEVAIGLFAAHGYAGTSIRDIAKLAGRSVSNVYHYFRDKEALWLAILEYSVKGMPERLRAALELPGSALERFGNLLRVHLQESVRHHREAKIFFIDEERLSPAGKRINKRIQKDIFDLYQGELARLQSEGIIGDVNLRVLTFNVLGVINWHLRWQDRIAGTALEDAHAQIIEFVLQGICHGRTDSVESRLKSAAARN